MCVEASSWHIMLTEVAQGASRPPSSACISRATASSYCRSSPKKLRRRCGDDQRRVSGHGSCPDRTRAGRRSGGVAWLAPEAMEVKMRQCKRCEEWKPLECFNDNMALEKSRHICDKCLCRL